MEGFRILGILFTTPSVSVKGVDGSVGGSPCARY